MIATLALAILTAVPCQDPKPSPAGEATWKLLFYSSRDGNGWHTINEDGSGLEDFHHEAVIACCPHGINLNTPYPPMKLMACDYDPAQPRQDAHRIFLAKLDGSGARPLTSGENKDAGAKLSFSEDRVAYLSS